MPQQTREPHPSTSGYAVAAVVSCQLMLMVDSVIVTVALPAIQAEFGIGPVALSWVLSAYALAFAGFLLVSGRIGTLVGPRRAMLAGVVVFVVASAAGGLAPDAALLVAARAVQGAGAALAGPAVLVLLVANTAEGPARLRGMSWYIVASSAGSAIGLVAGGLLTVTAGWRWVMLVNVPIGVLLVAATLAFVREPGRGAGRLDPWGAVLSSVVMIGLVYGLTRSGEAGWGDPQVLVALAAAALALVALVPVESRATHPVVPLQLVAGLRRATPYLGMLLMPACLIGFFYVSVLLLRDVRHLDALQTGLVFLPFAASVVAGGRLVPHLVPRIGERATVALGVVTAVAGALLFGLLAPGTPLWLGVLLPCLVIGFGPGLFFTVASNRIMADAPAPDAGSAAALLQSLQQLGGAVGVATLTAVYAGRSALDPVAAGTVAVVAAGGFGVVLLAFVLGTRAFPAKPLVAASA